MPEQCISLSLGRVAHLSIDRPKALNALNQQVFVELEAALTRVRQSEARCLVITGAGPKAFVAGADIAEMDASDSDGIAQTSLRGHVVFDQIEALSIPVIAAVNGFALGGGCELALACDIVYASHHAKFALPEVKLGLIPGFGGTERLPRKIGLGHACAWVFSGDIFDAAKAQAVGLVQHICAPDALLAEVDSLAERIASRAPLAIAAAKHIMVQARGADPASSHALERAHFVRLFATKDRIEGTQAFLNKREPTFKGL